MVRICNALQLLLMFDEAKWENQSEREGMTTGGRG